MTSENATPSRGPHPGSPGYKAPQPLSERIRQNVQIVEGGCWIWQGYTDAKGYGFMTVGSRVDGSYRTGQRVHRVAYETFVGPIPEGLHIDHLCENKACCNPAHLEPVTNPENKRRAGERMETCRRGHPRTPENAYANPATGKVQCRVCKRERQTAAVS